MDFYRKRLTEALNATNDPLEVRRIMRDYQTEHPFCKQCNKMSFLFYANYMIHNTPDLVDEEFLTLTEQVIEMSDITKDIDGVPKDQYREYRRLAKFTRQSIDEYRKKQKKDVAQEQTMQRSKLKQLFARINI